MDPESKANKVNTAMTDYLAASSNYLRPRPGSGRSVLFACTLAVFKVGSSTGAVRAKQAIEAAIKTSEMRLIFVI